MTDLIFHMESYIIDSFSVTFQSLYLLIVQRSSEHKTSLYAFYINSLLSLSMIFFLMVLFPDELSTVQSFEGCGLLNGPTFWCTMKNAALTTSVVDVLKSILQISFSLYNKPCSHESSRIVRDYFTRLWLAQTLCERTCYHNRNPCRPSPVPRQHPPAARRN
ncbi:unnamed protein product [Rotaria socialis]|uniref:Uncharacterized protein n=1 Tax=Rotaria socialis TaxID=392032 RepID=A0A821E6Z2_9BILA|nr:unnamed protein product [Rotaria socialis]